MKLVSYQQKDRECPHKFENEHHNNLITTKYGCNLFFLQLNNQKQCTIYMEKTLHHLPEAEKVILAHHLHSRYIKIKLGEPDTAKNRILSW